MTGNYGSEVLRPVRPAFRPIEPAARLFSPEVIDQAQAARTTYAAQLDRHPVSFAVFLQAPWHHYGLFALEQTQLSVRSPFLDNELVRTVFRAPRSALSSDDICLRLIGDGEASLRRIRTDRGAGGEQGPLSSVVSKRLLEFTFKAEYAYDYGMPQWVAKIDHVLSQFHLERLFLGRHKYYHFRVWYRDALSKYVQEMLLDRQTLSRPFLQGKTVEKLVHGHLKGNQNYTAEIHKMLTLELLHRLLLDAQ